jgi:tetratricopeptide (TPR) repeat protein
VFDAWKPSTATTRIDYGRMARLEPVEAAVAQLGLPLIRLRKLKTIVNAITVQIECGRDHPAVNGLLLDALRAEVRHQVGEVQGRAVLRAIDVFAEGAARRWEQVRAGTLPHPEPAPGEVLDDLIDEGQRLKEERQVTAACDRWLQAWQLVRRLTRPELRTTGAFDEAYGLGPLVSNWCSDLELTLLEAGRRNPAYHEHRLRYSREFLALFPDQDSLTVINVVRAEGESVWHLGRKAEAEAVFAALIERFPDDGMAYLGWSQLYWLEDESQQDFARAEAILQRALARPQLRYREELQDQLEALRTERAKAERPAGAPRPASAGTRRAVPSPPLTSTSRAGRMRPTRSAVPGRRR